MAGVYCAEFFPARSVFVMATLWSHYSGRIFATPYGAAVAELPIRGVGWQAGDSILLQGEVLRIGNMAAFTLFNAKMWKGMKTETLPPLTRDMRKAALEAVRKQLASGQREVGFSTILQPLGWRNEETAGERSVFYERAVEAIMRLRQCWFAGNMTYIVEAQKSLVGLGDGLTPSGDDFLTGYWAMMRVRGGETGRERSECAAATLAEELHRTTLYGRSEPLCSAIAAMGNASRRAEALSRLASFGGSTGLDTVLGVAEALRCMDMNAV